MTVVGVIAEYNPFHLGHLYQIDKIKEKFPDSTIVCLVSSCFTQRGEVSIINKWDKTLLLLKNKVDLVIEFPFVFATQAADIFAYGAISILQKLKIEVLVFGTESFDVFQLKKVAEKQLYDKNYNKLVKKYMDLGDNYPTSLSKAIRELGIEEIKKPNELLGLSYVKEIIKNKYEIEPLVIKRTNDYHSLDVKGSIISGSAIRSLIKEKKEVSTYVVDESCINKNLSAESYFELLRYQIINNRDNLDKFNTVDEGIENRLKKVIFEAQSWEELVYKIKSKRYTYNKINRMLVQILGAFTKEENRIVDIDYIRVLGFSSKGKDYLSKIRKKVNVPIVTGYREGISKLFDIEFRVSCIYYTAFDGQKELVKREFNKKPVIW